MNSRDNVLLTGYNGFIGGSILSLKNRGVKFVLCGRSKSDAAEIFFPLQDNLKVDTNALLNASVVIHSAALPIFNSKMDLNELNRVNIEWPIALAREAAAAGVRRFIFISSAKIHGESTTGMNTYSEDDVLAPVEPYSYSKFVAEAGLRRVAEETGLDVVIIRPTLVYGAGVKANFLALMKLSSVAIPLPFGCINNKRSMIYIGNLVDFIYRCIDHPGAANQTFLVSDGEDVSLRTLIGLMRKYMGRPTWFFPVPILLFKLVGVLAGRKTMIDRLTGNLQIDSSKAGKLLSWTPPYTVEQGIAATIADFINGKK